MFQVALGKIKVGVELQNVKNIFEAPCRELLALLFVDGRVSFTENVANCELSGVDSFCWSDEYSHLDQRLSFRTYNSTLKCLNEWDIQLSEADGTVNQVAEWSLVDTVANVRETFKDIPSQPAIRILQLNAQPVLLIHNVVVVLELGSSGLVEVAKSFQVKEFSSEGSTTDIIVQKKFLFVLKDTGIISIYSITCGHLVSTIKLINYWKFLYSGVGILSQNGKATRLAVSSNLQHLLVYFSGTKFALHHIHLDDYFKHFPNHLNTTAVDDAFIVDDSIDEDSLDFHKKSSVISRGWRNQVGRLNSKLRVKGETRGVGTSPLHNDSGHWFDNLMCNKQNLFTQYKDDQEKKITGFDKKLIHRQASSERYDHTTKKRRHSSSSSQDSDSISNKEANHKSFVFKLPKLCRHSDIHKLSVAMETATLWFKGKGHHGKFLLVDLRTNHQECIGFAEPTVVSTPCLDGQVPLMITTTTMSAIAVNVDQEYLINKVMTYESATLAERLCQCNSWAHCSIPIHALEVGLKHRQLDTIAFFLKCREGVFRNDVEGDSSTMDTQELWEAVDLLLTSIVENQSESQSKQYSDQLVHLTLTFVNHLIQNTWETQTALQKECEDDTVARVEEVKAASQKLMRYACKDDDTVARVEEVKAASQKLMRYACKLRGFLKDAPSWCSKGRDSVQDQKDETEGFKGYYWCGDKTKSDVAKFKIKSRKDVVESAILESCLPLAQAYLYQNMDQELAMGTDASINSSVETAPPSNSMYDLIQIGRSMVLRSLIDGNLKKASRILSNMGFNVTVELKQMCMQTTNRTVRDFLICELQKMSEFDAEEETAIEFIKHFEKLYPKHSFEKATLQAMERQNEHWKEPMTIECIPLEEEGGNIPSPSLEIDTSPLEEHDHTHLALEWVKLWDRDTRERILFERIIELDAEVPDIIPEDHISMESAWQFLTSRADWTQIQNWIKASFPLTGEDAAALAMPLNHPLETCVANQLGLTPDFMKDWILDELATRGVFCSNEIQDFNKLLHRLSRIHRVIASPHPLAMGRTQVDMNDFCNQFVSFCVKRHLCSVLYEFLDKMDLCLTGDDVTKFELPVKECPWLHMILHFRWVGQYLSDPSYMFRTSLACSRVFLDTFQPTVMSLLEADRSLAAMATLMYAPGTLQQAMTAATNSDDELWKVDAEVLENSLSSYHTLHSALFPHRVDGVPAQDISLYNLLQICFLDVPSI